MKDIAILGCALVIESSNMDESIEDESRGNINIAKMEFVHETERTENCFTLLGCLVFTTVFA